MLWSLRMFWKAYLILQKAGEEQAYAPGDVIGQGGQAFLVLILFSMTECNSEDLVRTHDKPADSQWDGKRALAGLANWTLP